jgi:hypothetical protein
LRQKPSTKTGGGDYRLANCAITVPLHTALIIALGGV